MNAEEYQNQIDNLTNQLHQRQIELNNLQNSSFSEKSSLQAQINDLSMQLQQRQADLEQVRLAFNNERNELQSRINNFETQKQTEINNLQNNFNQEKANLNTQISSLTIEVSKLNSQIEANRVGFETQNRNLNTQIHSKDSEIQNLQNKIDEDIKSILAKLSEHYKDYSDVELKNNKDNWYIKVKWAFGIVSVLTILLLLVFFFYDETLDKRIATFTLDVIAASWLWFCVNQFTYYKKLLTDYKNRAVVANSYLGVLNNTNDNEIKKEATKIVTETLFSRSSTDVGSELPLKEIVKIIGNITNKSS